MIASGVAQGKKHLNVKRSTPERKWGGDLTAKAQSRQGRARPRLGIAGRPPGTPLLQTSPASVLICVHLWLEIITSFSLTAQPVRRSICALGKNAIHNFTAGKVSQRK